LHKSVEVNQLRREISSVHSTGEKSIDEQTFLSSALSGTSSIKGFHEITDAGRDATKRAIVNFCVEVCLAV
jgi:hypothetical protein